MQNFPVKPQKNQLVSYESYIYQWDGKKWAILNPPDPTTVPIFVSREKPSLPLTNGSLWFNPANSILSVWAPKPTGYDWVSTIAESDTIPAVFVSTVAPKTSENGTLWYNPSSQVISVWTFITTPASWMILLKSPQPEPPPAVATVSESAPQYLTPGLLWYQPSSQKLQIWDGKNWVNSQEVRIDSSTPNVIYVGKAPQGSKENSPVWLVIRSTFSKDGILLSEKFARNITWSSRFSSTYL